MAPAISSLLRTHPVSLKDNLIKISSILGIDANNLKKTTLLSEIEECLKTYTNFEETVRNMADTMIAEHLQKKSTESQSNLGHSQSLFDDTQNDVSTMDTDQPSSEATRGSKRKLSDLDIDEIEAKFRRLETTRDFETHYDKRGLRGADSRIAIGKRPTLTILIKLRKR